MYLVFDVSLALGDKRLCLACVFGHGRSQLLVDWPKFRSQSLRRGADECEVRIRETEPSLQIPAQRVAVAAFGLELCGHIIQIFLVEKEMPIEMRNGNLLELC